MLFKSLFQLFLTSLLLIFHSQVLNAQVHVNSVSSTVSTCPNNGTITVDATSPSPPLLYSITAGPVTQQVQTNPVFNSLPVGNYTVKISDGAGNEVQEVVTIGGNYQNPAFTTVPTSPYCTGDGNGKLVVNLTTGTGLAPYSYELISPSPVTETQNDNVFENLPAGNYSVRVTDVCGSIRTNAITILPPDTKIYINTPPIFIKIGCDSMLIRYTIHTKSPRFPFSFRYETSNGTYIPPAGATIIDSSRVHTHGWVDIQEIIPGITYGNFVQVNVTNSCGERASNMNTSYPFNFYPRYSYNECGSSVNASYDITPNNRTDIHTSLKQPITYTYTDLSTGDTVASDTYSHPNYLFSRQGVSIQGGVVIPGKTYRLTLTDGCGQTFIQNYTIPTQAAPTLTPAINAIACIDSVVGTFGISFSGFGPGVRMVVLSGPSTLGSTKPEFSYSDTYTWPSDTLYPSGSRFYLNNLAPGTYQYRVMDNCGRELTRTLNVNMSQSLSRGVRIEKGCPGENKLVYHLIGKGKITVKSLPDNTILKTSSIDNFIVVSGQPKRDSILNLPSGQYEITYDYEHNIVNPLNDTPIPCWKIIDTITIPPYQNPEISVGNGIMCDDQISIELIPDITKGVPPFQYEIYSGPEIFPLQNSGIFPVSTVGTYYARIFDKCENASMKQITIDTLTFDPIDLTPDCKSKKVVFPRSMYFTYQWLLPNGQIYTGDSLFIHPVTPADTGNYEIRRITNINGCADTVKLTYHIDLPNYSERTISFCEGTTVVIDGNVYDTPGVYTDTLVTASGCDSLVVTTLMLLPQLSDTSVVSICDGDSVLISGNYYSASGFYTDSTQNTHGCYDLQVTELIVIGQFPVNQYVTLCNYESYLFGNNSYNTTGVYYDTIQSFLGCDSIVVLHLDILPEIIDSVNVTICEGEYYVFSGDVLSVSGVYADTLLSVYSCDSVVTLYLNVLPVKRDTVSVSVCEGESFYFGGQELTLTGVYQDTLKTSTACDSIVTLNLVILPHKHYQIYDTICEETDYVFGGLYYNHSGIYTHTFSTSLCDSIVTLNLTVIPAPSVLVTSVLVEGNNESAVVQLNGVSNTSPLNYFWESSSVLSNNSIKNPTITIKDATWVTLTVTDKYGCTSTFEHRVELPITSTIYIPNAVTPDGNEFNNIFRVYGTNISTFHIMIFNRWGEIIFESHDFNFGWDATYKGVVVQDGVYTYKLSAMGIDGVYYNKTGHVTVIK